ncbi:MAG: diacylglycerol kinase family protein [Pseudomonadota bacterium]
MTVRLLCLCNAGAGGKTGRADALRALLPDAANLRSILTQNAEHVSVLVDEFDGTHEDLIAISGGDGSLQWLLSLLAQRHERGLPCPRLAVLPGGSTNMSARDINRHHRWSAAAAVLAQVAKDGPQASTFVRRPVLRVHRASGVQAGFFLGAGAVVEGIDYCNRRLWAEGAARRELTAGLAMARTVLGVLRAEAPFDSPLPLALEAFGERESEAIRLAPSTGATVLAVSTLDRLLVGARPHWGAESGAVRFTLVERSARLLRHLGGLLGLPGLGRPGADAGYHSHNCTRLKLSFASERKAQQPASYAIDGEVFAAPAEALTVDADWAPEFLIL